MSSGVRGIAVEKRSIYEFGKRRRTVYDARGTLAGIEYSVTGKTPAEARALALRDVDYVRGAGFAEAMGCAVRPVCHEGWAFSIEPRGVVMSYGAIDLAAAVARIVESYNDHPDVQGFIAAVKAGEARVGVL